MIKDSFRYIEKYRGLSENINLAIEYLIKTDFCNVEPGRYEVFEDKVFAMVSQYTTRLKNTGKLEAHKKYLDIQYIVCGNELIGYSNIDGLKILHEYDMEKDICFLEGTAKDFLLLEEGDFAVFWPEDAHMPCISPQKPSSVKKVVVKVRL